MVVKKTKRNKTSTKRTKGNQMDRDELLDKLGAMATEMHNRILNSRVRDKVVFQAKISALRAFSYACSVYASVLKDKDLDALSDRLDRLEAGEEGSDVRTS